MALPGRHRRYGEYGGRTQAPGQSRYGVLLVFSSDIIFIKVL